MPPARLLLIYSQDGTNFPSFERARVVGVDGDRVGTGTAFRAIGGIWIGAEEVPGLLVSSVFGFGTMRGEEDLVLPSQNAKTGPSGDPSVRALVPR